MIRAAGRRAGHDDVEELTQLLELRRELDAAVLTAVVGLRASGWTWRQLGEATGTSKEAAVLKWASKVRHVQHRLDCVDPYCEHRQADGA